ncbi:MAG: hypothetical protein ACR2OA_03360 [Rubripirellula sp.]
MSFPRDRGVRVEADMTLERLEGATCVQSITVSSRRDGTLLLACTGKFPSASWEQLRRVRSLLRKVAEITEQNVVVTNDGKTLVSVAQKPDGKPKVAIRWWAVARQFLLGSN